jgi:hypothetical protein
MVMLLLRSIHRPDPQYLATSVRDSKCTHVGYGIRLSR